MLRLVLVIFLLQPLILLADDSIPEKKSPEYRDWLFVDFTHDNWLNIPDGIKSEWFSRGVTASLYRDIKFGSSAFGFAFGIGVSSHNVHHNARFLNSGDSILINVRTEKYSKNKLTSTYIEVPFELRFRTRGNNPFRFYPGFKFGYLAGIHSKWVDDTGKWKFYSYPGVDPIRFGPTVRLGAGSWGVMGFYQLNPLFRKNRGPQLIPWSAGISFSW